MNFGSFDFIISSSERELQGKKNNFKSGTPRTGDCTSSYGIQEKVNGFWKVQCILVLGLMNFIGVFNAHENDGRMIDHFIASQKLYS